MAGAAHPRIGWLCGLVALAISCAHSRAGDGLTPAQAGATARHAETAKVPTADAIVDEYFTARGGRAALEDLRHVVRLGEATFFLPQGEFHGTYRTCVGYPDRVMVEIDAGPVQVLEAIAAGRGHLCDRATRRCDQAGERKTQELAGTAREANRELLYEQDLWGEGTVEQDGDVWVVRSAGDEPTTYRFSRDTRLLVSKSRGNYTRRYDDWRRVEGVMFPFAIDDFVDDRLSVRVRLREIHQPPSLDEAWCGAELRALAR
jgi:hypothetical protein